MVFSFFKKNSEKMPEREIMRPKPAAAPTPATPAVPTAADGAPETNKPAEPLPDLEFTPSGTKGPAAPVKPTSTADLQNQIREFEEEFTQSAVLDIDVDHGADSLQSDVEQVAVLYANGQDTVVRPLLESLVYAYPGVEGIRLWHMLFDLLQLSGDRAAFDKLSSEFVQACETSPPTWRQSQPTLPANAQPGVAGCSLQGVLTSENMSVLQPLENAIRSKKPLQVDCGGLIGCDDEIAGKLAELLMSARKHGVPVVVEQIDHLIPKLRNQLPAGEAKHVRSWMLLLELLQRCGTQETFEEAAIDFAVTFERSPPSWESTPAPRLPAAPKSAAPVDTAHYLSGEIKNCRFEDMTAILAQRDQIVIDFSAVRRIDFFSAGQLVNCLSKLKDGGRDITLRNPNFLVAELMIVVGLNRLARIIVPKS